MQATLVGFYRDRASSLSRCMPMMRRRRSAVAVPSASTLACLSTPLCRNSTKTSTYIRTCSPSMHFTHRRRKWRRCASVSANWKQLFVGWAARTCHVHLITCRTVVASSSNRIFKDFGWWQLFSSSFYAYLMYAWTQPLIIQYSAPPPSLHVVFKKKLYCTYHRSKK